MPAFILPFKVKFFSSNVSRKNLLTYTYGFISVVIWAMLPTLVKYGVARMNVFSFLFIRFFSASLLLFPFFVAFLKKNNRIFLKNIKFISLFFLNNIFIFYWQTKALDQMPATWYVMLFSLSPLISLILLKYRVSVLGLLGYFLAGLSTYLFISSHTVYQEPTEVSLSSFFYLMASILSWSFYIFTSKKIQVFLKDVEIVILTNFSAFFLYASILLFHLKTTPNILQLSLYDLALPFLVGVLTTVAFFLFSFSLRNKPVFSIYIQYIEPILAIFIASFFLNENVTLIQYLLAVLVFLGICVANRFSYKREVKVVS